MQYYYLEHECSLCFVKWYSILLVLVSWLCFAFKINFLKKFKQTNNWDTHAKVSEDCQMSELDMTSQMKYLCFLNDM